MFGLLALLGVRQLRSDAADKVAVISRYVNTPVNIVAVVGGKTASIEYDQPGVLTSVDKTGVTVLQTDGRKEYVFMADVRGLENRYGATIKRWR